MKIPSQEQVTRAWSSLPQPDNETTSWLSTASKHECTVDQVYAAAIETLPQCEQRIHSVLNIYFFPLTGF